MGIALICLLGVAMFGGRITFWEALAVSAYAFLPVAVFRGLVGLLIMYIKAPENLDPLHDQAGIINENLGVLFSPMQQPVLYTIATFFETVNRHLSGVVVPLFQVFVNAINIRVKRPRLVASSNCNLCDEFGQSPDVVILQNPRCFGIELRLPKGRENI